MISNCSKDENAKYHGGKAGDQTGQEWRLQEWYSRPWNCVLRHPNPEVRQLIATLAIEAANNDKIGYDQYQRLTFWEKLKQANYRPINIDEKCEADCSSGVAAIVKAAGHLTGNENLATISERMYTGNQRQILKQAGFNVLKAAKYLNSDEYLMVGDILLNDDHHTVINVTDGSAIKKDSVEKVAKDVIAGKYGNGADRKSKLEALGYNYEEIQNEVNRILASDTPKKSNEEIADEVISGKWGNGDDRKRRLTEAGYDYAAVQAIVNAKLNPPTKRTKYKVVNVKTYLNVRTEPSKNSESIGKLRNNEVITVTDIVSNGSWAKLADGGYVATNYISKV